MGRKHRSTSLGDAPAKVGTSTPSTPQMTTSDNLSACHTLANHFVHCKNSDGGRTPFHRAVLMASSADSNHDKDDESNKKLDGLHMLDVLSDRMKYLDSAAVVVSKRSNRQQRSHYHKMMLTADDESGYTPLHSAVLNRDLMTLLVLLKHAASSATLEDNDQNIHVQQHPLQLLNGNIPGLSAAGEDGNEQQDIINQVAAALDNEHLTPLQLLGRTSERGLEQCRNTLRWKNLRRMWQHSGEEESTRQRGDSKSYSTEGSSGGADENPRQHTRRRRMISFGDDRDYDSIDYDIEAEEDGDRGEDGRPRGNSFNVDLGDVDGNDGREDNSGANNDLVTLDDNVDFGLLADHREDRSNHQQQNSEQRTKSVGAPHNAAAEDD